MSLKLSYNGEDIIDYNPIERQWWITGFNPEHKDVAAGELTVIFTVDFTGRESMYYDFYNTWSDDKRWNFNAQTYTAIFTFK